MQHVALDKGNVQPQLIDISFQVPAGRRIEQHCRQKEGDEDDEEDEFHVSLLINSGDIFFFLLISEMSLTVAVADLPYLVFIDNVKNFKMDLTIELLTARDLFEFLVDLLTKGIVILFGKEKKSVELNALGAEEMEIVYKKLSNAGIELIVDISPPAPDLGVHFRMLHPDTAALSSYRLVMNDANRSVSIGFGLRRVFSS